MGVSSKLVQVRTQVKQLRDLRWPKVIKVLLEEIGAGEYGAIPGRQCHWCDFRPFCPPGRAYVATNPR
jgi:PD-(D/E)XK nuclease superfamily